MGQKCPEHQESVEQLRKAIQEEKDIIPYLQAQDEESIQFCHNDLNRLNILCSTLPDDQMDLLSLKLIDYEYGEYNYLGFEIANYFNESCFDLTVKQFPFYHHTDYSPDWQT